MKKKSLISNFKKIIIKPPQESFLLQNMTPELAHADLLIPFSDKEFMPYEPHYCSFNTPSSNSNWRSIRFANAKSWVTIIKLVFEARFMSSMV